MTYYVYFDAYRRPVRVLSEETLIRDFNGDPEVFLRNVSKNGPGGDEGRIIGHVGTFSFETEKELVDYLDKCGEEITGFYECEDGSRPYNF